MGQRVKVDLKHTIGFGVNRGMGKSCSGWTSVSMDVEAYMCFGVVGFLGDPGWSFTLTILVTGPLVVSLVTHFTL
jgi:hypothetical protein